MLCITLTKRETGSRADISEPDNYNISNYVSSLIIIFQFSFDLRSMLSINYNDIAYTKGTVFCLYFHSGIIQVCGI
jgi:hypothetical protein